MLMYEVPFTEKRKNTVFCDGGRLFVSINFACLQSKNMQTAVIPTVVLCEPFAKVNKFYKDNLFDLFQTSTTQIFKN